MELPPFDISSPMIQVATLAGSLGGILFLAKRDAIKSGYGKFLLRHRISSLEPAGYRVIHGVEFDTDDGGLLVDHLVISRFGIFPLMRQEYVGKILGGPQMSHWIQRVNLNSVKFDNPLLLAQQLKRDLSRVSGVPEKHIHPLVVFTSARLQSALPSNVLVTDAVLPHIRSYDQAVLEGPDVGLLWQSLVRLGGHSANKGSRYV
jgi:hypothetical protein